LPLIIKGFLLPFFGFSCLLTLGRWTLAGKVKSEKLGRKCKLPLIPAHGGLEFSSFLGNQREKVWIVAD
jgi:hypothetical protein